MSMVDMGGGGGGGGGGGWRMVPLSDIPNTVTTLWIPG